MFVSSELLLEDNTANSKNSPAKWNGKDKCAEETEANEIYIRKKQNKKCSACYQMAFLHWKYNEGKRVITIFLKNRALMDNMTAVKTVIQTL